MLVLIKTLNGEVIRLNDVVNKLVRFVKLKLQEKYGHNSENIIILNESSGEELADDYDISHTPLFAIFKSPTYIKIKANDMITFKGEGNSFQVTTHEGDAKSTTEGDAKSTTEGDAKSTTEGDAKSTTEGDAKSTHEGDAKSTTESTTEGDAKSTTVFAPLRGIVGYTYKGDSLVECECTFSTIKQCLHGTQLVASIKLVHKISWKRDGIYIAKFEPDDPTALVSTSFTYNLRDGWQCVLSEHTAVKYVDGTYTLFSGRDCDVRKYKGDVVGIRISKKNPEIVSRYNGVRWSPNGYWEAYNNKRNITVGADFSNMNDAAECADYLNCFLTGNQKLWSRENSQWNIGYPVKRDPSLTSSNVIQQLLSGDYNTEQGADRLECCLRMAIHAAIEQIVRERTFCENGNLVQKANQFVTLVEGSEKAKSRKTVRHYCYHWSRLLQVFQKYQTDTLSIEEVKHNTNMMCDEVVIIDSDCVCVNSCCIGLVSHRTALTNSQILPVFVNEERYELNHGEIFKFTIPVNSNSNKRQKFVR